MSYQLKVISIMALLFSITACVGQLNYSDRITDSKESAYKLAITYVNGVRG